MSGKVMVVDSDPEMRLILSDFLSRMGVDHVAVPSAGECLKRIVSTPTDYALVLIDSDLPYLSTADTLSWIASSDSEPMLQIPFVTMMGDAECSFGTAPQPACVQGQISKPVSLESLRDVVEQFRMPALLH